MNLFVADALDRKLIIYSTFGSYIAASHALLFFLRAYITTPRVSAYPDLTELFKRPMAVPTGAYNVGIACWRSASTSFTHPCSAVARLCTLKTSRGGPKLEFIDAGNGNRNDVDAGLASGMLEGKHNRNKNRKVGSSNASAGGQISLSWMEMSEVQALRSRIAASKPAFYVGALGRVEA